MKQIWRDFWNTRYTDGGSVYGTEPLSFLKNNLSYISPKGRVLLPADGYGRNGVFLATQGFDVHSFDGSQVAVAQSLLSAEEAGVRIKASVSAVADFDFGVDLYDAVVSSYFHLQPELPFSLHEKYVTCLKAGGVIILEGFAKEQMQYQSGGPRDVDMLFSEDILRADFKGFDILSLNTSTEILNNGAVHQGEGVVIRLLARKK